MVIFPLEWFFDGNCEYLDHNYGDSYQDDNPAKQMRVNWQNLEHFGWDSCYLDSLNYAEIPTDPGIYVVVHELEKPVLYVGQATNLKRRITNQSHHKISKIIKIYESAPMGYHNLVNVRMEIRVFWKCVGPPYYNGSLEKYLVWCESIAIGLLCPILQARADDVKKQDWAIGMDYYD